MHILGWIHPFFGVLEPELTFSKNENYGDSAANETNDNPTKSGAIATVLLDRRILSLGLASCFFEGSMYLFVFFWTPALKAAHVASGATAGLPLGMIFACFMGSIMIGSLSFNLVVSTYQWISHARLLTIVFATASSSLLVPILVKDEYLTFYGFCIFEACVGMYWPSMGFLKGRLIDDGNRAQVYSVMRIPLNIFVVVALAMVEEGPEYRLVLYAWECLNSFHKAYWSKLQGYCLPHLLWPPSHDVWNPTSSC